MPTSSTFSPSTVVITGTNAAFADFATGTILSLTPARRRYGFRLVVLDYGMTKEQQGAFESLEVEVIPPRWCFRVPEEMRTPTTLAKASRLVLPELVPGHEVYLWIDADVWAQDHRFFPEFAGPASRGELAVVHEAERVYPFDLTIARWAVHNLCAMRALVSQPGSSCIGRNRSTLVFLLCIATPRIGNHRSGIISTR